MAIRIADENEPGGPPITREEAVAAFEASTVRMRWGASRALTRAMKTDMDAAMAGDQEAMNRILDAKKLFRLVSPEAVSLEREGTNE